MVYHFFILKKQKRKEFEVVDFYAIGKIMAQIT